MLFPVTKKNTSSREQKFTFRSTMPSSPQPHLLIQFKRRPNSRNALIRVRNSKKFAESDAGTNAWCIDKTQMNHNSSQQPQTPPMNRNEQGSLTSTVTWKKGENFLTFTSSENGGWILGRRKFCNWYFAFQFLGLSLSATSTAFSSLLLPFLSPLRFSRYCFFRK